MALIVIVFVPPAAIAASPVIIKSVATTVIKGELTIASVLENIELGLPNLTSVSASILNPRTSPSAPSGRDISKNTLKV